MECEYPLHLYEIEEDEVVPRDRKCFCGEYTWGYMDDQLTLTEMWEATP